MRTLILAFLLVPPSVNAQFLGGNGRGDVAWRFVPAAIPSHQYRGGSGRGNVATHFLPLAIPSNLYSGGSGRGDVTIRLTPPASVVLALHAFLEGPYMSATGLMNDALRTLPSFPLIEPYTTLGYAHTGGGGGESLVPGVLTAIGNNALVDWVVVELRDAVVPSTVVASRSALLQRDGDVVATDGVSPLLFVQAPGNYHVALRHRNHLGVMTGSAQSLGSSTTPLNLASVVTTTFGTAARKGIPGDFPTQALWAGDVTFNGQMKYTGPSNDRDPILTTVGSTTPNNAVSLYSTRDVNLDGTVKYTGSGNDRDPILVNVGSTTPNNVRAQQLP